MRRTLTLAVLAVLLLTLVQPAVAGKRPYFWDVPSSHWAADAIARLWSSGVVKGGPDLAFRPDDPVTRAEFVKMLLLGDGIAVGSECAGTFTDLPCAHWAAPYVETAYRMAIVTGYSGGSFNPSGLVSREEMVTMLERAMARTLVLQKLPNDKVATALSRFVDATDIAPWARGAVAVAHAEGVASGLPDGSFAPRRAATRADAAVFVVRSLLSRGARAAAAAVDGRQVRYTKLLNMHTTAYAAGEVGVGSITASGLPVRLGSVSVDPTVIPLGTLLYVQGYGYAIACDTGGAIRGDHIDLYLGDAESAKNYGVQTASVYIVDTPSPATALAGV